MLFLLLGFETSEHVSNVVCKSENNSGFADDPLLLSLQSYRNNYKLAKVAHRVFDMVKVAHRVFDMVSFFFFGGGGDF